MPEISTRKHYVNLLVPELLPVQQRLTLGRLAVLALVLLVALAVAGLWLNSQRAATQQALVALQQQSAVLQQQLTEQLASLAPEERAESLDLALQQTREQVVIQQLLVQELVGREKLKNEGFSELLAQLASHHERDVWLSRIQIEQGNIALHGNSLDSAAVPRWVQGLKSAPVLTGRQFASLQINRDDNGALTFSLLSQLPEGAEAGAPFIEPVLPDPTTLADFLPAAEETRR